MSEAKPEPPTRVLSVDAYRGFVMFLMMAEVLHFSAMNKTFPDSTFWKTISFHTSHVEWGGCSLHDLIQPSFSFLVGVSLPFSIAARVAREQSKWMMLFHAVWRSLLLIAIGIFLRSIGRPQTNFTFTDTLGQIGLGYTALFLLGLCKPKIQWSAFGLLLLGYWALFAFWPLPPVGYNYKAAGVSAKWRQQYAYHGFNAHWNKNTNPAAEFDVWWLNLFPRPQLPPTALDASTLGLLATPMAPAPLIAAASVYPGRSKVAFLYETGGYATLSFIPTLATMILGLIAGTWLRKEWTPWQKWALFLLAGLAGLALGEALERLGVCPIVKRIWTPAWVLYSGGWSFLFLAGFYLVIEIVGFWHWAVPLLVIGANSIVAYCLADWPLLQRFIVDSWKTHLGKDTFLFFGPEWEPALTGLTVLITLWLVLFWMYRNKIFVRI